MRSLVRAVTLVVAFVQPAELHAAAAADLHWLAGCWAIQGGESGSEEHWLAPAGGALLGVSRTVRSGRTIEYEFMRIEESDPGQLTFIAHPSGQPEATFRLLRLAASEVVFENNAHDFPQRITYRLGKGSLVARIEGAQEGENRSVDFPMDPIPCPGLAR